MKQVLVNWSARELIKCLDYSSWQKFENVIKKAQISCSNSKQKVSDHFNHLDKMVKDKLNKLKFYSQSQSLKTTSKRPRQIPTITLTKDIKINFVNILKI